MRAKGYLTRYFCCRNDLEALNYLDRLESIMRRSGSEDLKNVLKILVNRISADPVTRKVTCTFYKLPIPRHENNCVGFVMPEAGIEPARGLCPTGF